MAAETIGHAHGHLLGNDVHGLYLAMAGLARDSRSDVRPMVEEDVIGKGMDALPHERLAVALEKRQALDGRLICLGHPVAVHAGVDGWDSRLSTASDAAVTVLAGDLERAGMQAV